MYIYMYIYIHVNPAAIRYNLVNAHIVAVLLLDISIIMTQCFLSVLLLYLNTQI